MGVCSTPGKHRGALLPITQDRYVGQDCNPGGGGAEVERKSPARCMDALNQLKDPMISPVNPSSLC